MNRGRRREKIFLDSSDYQALVDLPVNVSDMFKAQVVAFALMSNHCHLLVRTPEGNINRIMRHVGAYTRASTVGTVTAANSSAGATSPPQNGKLPRLRKKPDRLCMFEYTARPGFFRFLASHHF